MVDVREKIPLESRIQPEVSLVSTINKVLEVSEYSIFSTSLALVSKASVSISLESTISLEE